MDNFFRYFKREAAIPDNTDPGTGGADSGSGEEFPDLEA